MNKTLSLKNLFSEWKNKFFLDDSYYEDGIINEQLFHANPSGKRILFIAKEPNGKNHTHLLNPSFVEEWNNLDPPAYTFAYRIAEWSFGIINEFPPYTEATNHPEYLKRIAFMNLKKIKGIGLAKKDDINQFINKHKDFLLGQIQIIDADIIILCSSFNLLVRSTFFKDAEWNDSGYGIEVARNNRSKVIDFYHPSSRNAPAASYSLLQNVITSPAFRKL